MCSIFLYIAIFFLPNVFSISKNGISESISMDINEKFRTLSNENRDLKEQLNKMYKLLTNTVRKVSIFESELGHYKQEVQSLENKLDASERHFGNAETDIPTVMPNKLSIKSENITNGERRGVSKNLNGKQDKRNVFPIRKRLVGGVGPVVAFSVTMNVNNENLAIGQTVSFDHVITNIGGGFIGSTSTFRAPESGLYHFDVIIMSHKGEDVQTEIVKDGTEVARLYSGDSSSFGVGVQSVVLYLTSGSSVWVRVLDNPAVNNGNIRIFGLHWSSFSGFLIQRN